MKILPDDLTPLNIQAYFYNHLGACGCSELDEMISTIKRVLEWHKTDIPKRDSYISVFPEELGIFYIIVGLLDNLDLVEHGTSIRWGWLTNDGKRLLEALIRCSPKEIEDAFGTAYDGVYYPEL